MTGVLDHLKIELKVPWFKDKQPSSEEIVVWIWEQLEPNIAEGKLYKIRLVETSFNLHRLLWSWSIK